jgi:hypothetical protein
VAPGVVKVRLPLIEETTMIEPPPRLQMRHGEMQRQIGAAQVDGDRPVELFRLQVVDRRPDAVDAGIGDDDVEPPEFSGKPIDRCAHPALVGNVGFEHQRFCAGLLDLSGSFSISVLVWPSRATFAPSAASFIAAALPMPEPAPVTRAT